MGDKSGIHWVSWADAHAKNSADIEDLVEPFKGRTKAFIKALEEAGAKVKVIATRRDEKRAYLFHWCWLIGLGKAKASAAKKIHGVDIDWDHGSPEKSRAGAYEMITGFGLAIPPKSDKIPSDRSNHIAGKAIDMVITWNGTIEVVTKRMPGIIKPFSDELKGMPVPGVFGFVERNYELLGGRRLLAPHLAGALETVSVTYMKNVNKNVALHKLGAKFGVRKLASDAPHWSADGK